MSNVIDSVSYGRQIVDNIKLYKMDNIINLKI